VGPATPISLAFGSAVEAHRFAEKTGKTFAHAFSGPPRFEWTVFEIVLDLKIVL